MPKMESNGSQKDPEPMTTPEYPQGQGVEEKCQNGIYLPTAPKGKPKAPPLIQRKVSPNEAGVDSGSKIPLLKTKQVDREALGENPRRASNSNPRVGSSSRRSLLEPYSLPKSKDKDSKTSGNEKVHRSFEKVRLPKGIEMQRVVQETNGVTSKRFVSSGSLSTTTVKETSQQRGSDVRFRRKMTKTEASFTEVKSFTSFKSTRSNITVGKHFDAATSSTNEKTKPDTNEVNQNPDTNNEKAVNDATSSYKTVEEFLKMPETSLPGGSTSKRTLYKSKFWEYLDSKPQAVSKCSLKDQKKSYNPDEVKSFMEKQKELRKLQQQKESKEKQSATERRQQLLKELDSKCHRIALKGKQRNETAISTDQNPDENVAKKRKIELESPSLKYLKPLLEHKHGAILRRSDNFRADTTKQAKYLLSEFENIVKRECISFLQRIPLQSETNTTSPLVEKVDKGVGTSVAESISQKEEDSIEDGESFEMVVETIKSTPSPAAVVKAITKIQAFYRGYKVRQVLKQAKVELRKRSRSRKSDEFPSQQHRGRPRRWSFPKLPETPYDSSSMHGRLLPMSPIPMSGTGICLDRLMPCYIPPPPPPATSQASKSPSRPKVLPSSPFTPVRLRVYDDPYPKQVKGTMVDSSPVPVPCSSAGLRHSILKDATFDDFVIPSPLPSIVDVLREKLRLFSTGFETINQTSAKAQQAPKNEKAEEISCTVTDKAVSAHLDLNTNESSAHQLPNSVHQDSQEPDSTPRIRKHKRRSRKLPTTTVDTDVEYLTGAGATESQSAASISSSRRRSPNPTNTRSEGSLSSSGIINEPSVSSSLGEFLAPALRLRYEAEKEHLKIIEKALQVKLRNVDATAESVQPGRIENSRDKTKESPESHRVQLAIANCHKESMKAAAEMAKWMADFQKTTQQQDKGQVQQTSIDLAAMVHAAVEEARITGERKRRENQVQKRTEIKLKPTPQIEHRRSTPNNQSQEGEDMIKVDKSVETSLAFYKNQGIANQVDGALTHIPQRARIDYQQQFPSASESERESPAPAPLSPSSVSAQFNDTSAELQEDSSIISVKESEHIQLVSPPPSSSTLKSASVLSEECSMESPQTDQIQLEIPISISVNEDSVIESVAEQISQGEPEIYDKSSDNNEIQGMLSGSDIQYEDEIVSEKESPKVGHVSKSPEVSMALVSSNEIEESPKSDSGASPVPFEDGEDGIQKDSQAQFPSTFESDVESPVLSKDTIGVEILEDINSNERSTSFIPVESKEDSFVKSDGPVEDDVRDSDSVVSPPCPATYSIESANKSASQDEISEGAQKDEEQEEIAGGEKMHEVLVESPEEMMGSTFQTQKEEASAPVEELSTPADVVSEKDVTVDIEETEGAHLPEESLQESQQHISSDYESKEDESSTSLKDASPTPFFNVETGDVHEESHASISPIHEIDTRVESPSPVKSDAEPRVESPSPVKSDAEPRGESPSPVKSDAEPRVESSSPVKSEIEPSVESSSPVKSEIVSRVEIPSPVKSDIQELGYPMKPPPPYSPSKAFKPSSVTESPHSSAEFGPSTRAEHIGTPAKSGVPAVDIQLEEGVQAEVGNEGVASVNDSVETSFNQTLIERPGTAVSEPYVDMVEDTMKDDQRQLPKYDFSTSTDLAAEGVLQAADYKTKGEIEIPLKPPPPYSPSSSLDSTSLSSRSLIISLQHDRIERIVREQAELIWEVWNKEGEDVAEPIPGFETVLSRLTLESQTPQDNTEMGRNGNLELTQSAVQNFDSLLYHLVYETIKEVLQVENPFTSYIERVRPGPLALHAQKLKVPRTKESLISIVIKRVTSAIPSNFFSEPSVNSVEKHRGKKWCSRPRELVDEILLDELVEEDYQWTEWWPEQVIVVHCETKEIIQGLIKGALKNRKYVNSQ